MGSIVLAVGAGSELATSAAAGDRPTEVAFVRASKKVYVHPDNSLTVTVRVKCVPGWFSSDLDVWLGQDTNYAEGFTATDVACDAKWHPVSLRLTNMGGPMHRGAVSITSQFSIYNNDTGDPAAAHEVQKRGRIRPAHKVH
jgi:hypothetical protein